MERRNFITAITSLFGPAAFGSLRAGRHDCPGRPGTSAESSPIGSSTKSEDEDALAAWRRLPMQPIIAMADLDFNSSDFPTAVWILIRLSNPEAFLEFFYNGGTEPGSRRRVLPAILYHKIQDPALPHPPLYLLGWCTQRNAPRNFRVDRISIVS